jgi:hypothetical protein
MEIMSIHVPETGLSERREIVVSVKSGWAWSDRACLMGN